MQEARGAFGVLFFNLFLVMVGFGIIIPVLPFFVLELHGTPATVGLLMATYSLMQFFFSPFWGRLSDRVGRRPVFLVGILGYGISFILFGLSRELWMLFAIRTFSGIVSSAALPTAMAYIADITGERERAGGMGLMGAAMGAGMIFGPALGGWLGHYGYAFPFFAAGGLALLSFPFALFFLKESLPPEARAKIKKEPARPRRPWSEVLKSPLFFLFALTFAVSFTMALFQSTFALFAAERAGLGPREMGFAFTFFGVLGIALQTQLGRLTALFGEARVLLGGMAVAAAGFPLILLARSFPTLIFFTTVFNVGNMLLRPVIAVLVTKANRSAHGATVGLMQAFDSLGRIFGPVLGGGAYELYPGAPYLLGAAILSLLLPLTARGIKAYASRAEAFSSLPRGR